MVGQIMLSKLSASQITSMFRQKKQLSENLTFYFQKTTSFAFQTIFSKKTTLNHPQKNKIKRQIREILFHEKFSKLPTHLLIVSRGGETNFSSLKKNLQFLKEQLKTKLSN